VFFGIDVFLKLNVFFVVTGAVFFRYCSGKVRFVWN